MIEIRADREKVVIEQDTTSAEHRLLYTTSAEHRLLSADQGEAPYQRPVRIRCSDDLCSVVITLRWSKSAHQVQVSLRRGEPHGEIMSTDVQDGESPDGIVLKVYTGMGGHRVTRLKARG